MQQYLRERNSREAIKWQMRVGIHSGQVTAGIVGKMAQVAIKFGLDGYCKEKNIKSITEATIGRVIKDLKEKGIIRRG